MKKSDIAQWHAIIADCDKKFKVDTRAGDIARLDRWLMAHNEEEDQPSSK